ncbi:MAG: hypothetical protein K2Z81_24400, partial [Cyanobacteria bacterium]|nr:hypothetical protein [Cyanobacteriota bacterium]
MADQVQRDELEQTGPPVDFLATPGDSAPVSPVVNDPEKTSQRLGEGIWSGLASQDDPDESSEESDAEVDYPLDAASGTDLRTHQSILQLLNHMADLTAMTRQTLQGIGELFELELGGMLEEQPEELRANAPSAVEQLPSAQNLLDTLARGMRSEEDSEDLDINFTDIFGGLTGRTPGAGEPAPLIGGQTDVSIEDPEDPEDPPAGRPEASPSVPATVALSAEPAVAGDNTTPPVVTAARADSLEEPVVAISPAGVEHSVPTESETVLLSDEEPINPTKSLVAASHDSAEDFIDDAEGEIAESDEEPIVSVDAPGTRITPTDETVVPLAEGQAAPIDHPATTGGPATEIENSPVAEDDGVETVPTVDATPDSTDLQPAVLSAPGTSFSDLLAHFDETYGIANDPLMSKVFGSHAVRSVTRAYMARQRATLSTPPTPTSTPGSPTPVMDVTQDKAGISSDHPGTDSLPRVPHVPRDFRTSLVNRASSYYDLPG